MKVSNSQWAEKLAGKIPEALAREIDIYETEITLRKQGKIDERLFAETRLRRGTYGQRYDNGQRHDGKKAQEVVYPSGALTKGPSTMWDAPGMQRIKIPAGGLNATQLETMADLAEEYSDSIAHITTRQDFQLHYVHIDNTPNLMRRLAAANITTREACGLSARPSRLPKFRTQVQAGVQRMRAARLRAHEPARHWIHRQETQRKWQGSPRL